MSGRHRTPPRSLRPLVVTTVVTTLVAGVAALGWIYRDGLLALAGFGDAETSRTPAPGPTASPTPAPTPAPSPTPEPKGRLVIHGTGDVNLDPSYIPTLAAEGYGYAWSGLGGLFKRDDLTVINLECPVSDLGSPVPKEFNFRCDPNALPAARRAGVEAANLANNHSGDYGPEAMLDSRRHLRRAGIEPVGVGQNLRGATRPAVFEIEGWRVAVLGFGGVIPAFDWLADEDHPGMASGDDIPTMVRAVRRADRRADLVIVSIHWGAELETRPQPGDVERAHAMIDAGADAIFGHHAHRLQPMEHYRGKPIAWGLGNFVWPRFSQAGSTTAIARVVVTPGGKVRGKLLPAIIEDHGHPVRKG